MELQSIKGIGDKTVKLFNKLGIYNTNDLINYFPFRYEVIKRSDVNNLKDNDKIIIDGVIENIPNLYRINKKLDKMTFRINSGEQLFNVTIFNRGFLKSSLRIGSVITVIGKYNVKNNSITANDIKLMTLGNKITIEPIYHKVSGLSNKQIHNYINKIIDQETISYIPNYLEEKYHFLDHYKSLNCLHNPTDLKLLKQARLRFKYEELFLFMLKMTVLKMSKKNNLGLKRNISYTELTDIIKQLPFTLTVDQKKAIDMIYSDLNSNIAMNRLLQGDVGSGKTIVAFLTIYLNYLSGYQSALMAPTEILSIQHYHNFLEIFKNKNINCRLLTGKTSLKEKRKIYDELKTGKIDVIIGTHALISDNVNYYNLGLVVTDEQHRFGVKQRENLYNKGITPDILYMSATPIPRTYAITLYGDMDISSIKTMPSGRKPVITYLKSNKEIKDVLNLMYNQLENSHQIYVIAPLIEDNDKLDLDSIYKLEYKMNLAFGKKYNVGILHGKLNNKEKEEVMSKFKHNDIQILISTTVVEVGVDVKNATMMVIFDSYRFGLSTLHQLRGRVGRNSLDSYCVLISDRETKRLDILTKTNDGFKISEEDFKLRGSGDIFGIRQSGDMCFNIADIKQDFDLVLKAKEDSEAFIKNKEYLKIENKHIIDLVKSSSKIS